VPENGEWLWRAFVNALNGKLDYYLVASSVDKHNQAAKKTQLTMKAFYVCTSTTNGYHSCHSQPTNNNNNNNNNKNTNKNKNNNNTG